MLSTEDHRRDRAGLRYVYPVISRRAGGVSVGINLNVNNACNWACLYCQVENLTKGGPPPVDLSRLNNELRDFLKSVCDGDYLLHNVPEGYRQLVDIAFSGNGEPTSASEFSLAVTMVGDVLREQGLLGKVPVRLITNGSLIHRPGVQEGIREIAALGGEVWFKLDRGDPAQRQQINGAPIPHSSLDHHLDVTLRLAPTWIQTCWFRLDGAAPDEEALAAYCAVLTPFAARLAGIHLYGLARPSLQAEAHRLTRMSAEEMAAVAKTVQEKTGIRVLVSP